MSKPNPTKLQTLKTRAEFQRVRGGGRSTTTAFVVEGKTRTALLEPALSDTAPPVGPRFGFTITRKVGNAVLRNRIRRRLRAALLEIAPSLGDAMTDYVVVARAPAAIQEYKTLVADLKRAVAKVSGGRPRGKSH